MKYEELVSVYEELDATAATLEKTAILAEAFSTSDKDHLSMVVKLVRGKVFANWESVELGVSSSLTLEAIEKATGIPETDIEDIWREKGDLGSAAEIAIAEKAQQSLVSNPVTVSRVYNTLQDLAAFEGEGSQARRVDTIAGLLSDASPHEAKYIVRTIVGAMRLGVGEGLIRDAIAEAFLDGTDEAIGCVERGYEVTNDFAVVANRAKSDGREGLNALDIELFRPIKPMLAQKASDVSEALDELGDEDGDVLFETKYDGIRAKLHRRDDEIRLYTRRLEDVTTQFPDIIEAVEQGIDSTNYIIEGEIVGYDPETTAILPFQELSQRIKRKYNIEAMSEEIPVTLYVFDILYMDQQSLLEQPLRHRIERLTDIHSRIPQALERADYRQTSSLTDATNFYEEVVRAGHEGVMAKNLDATYQPGNRVGYQLKIKTTMEPLDLVVTRAKWSEGRKSDYLGRPYLACRDTDSNSFKEVGRMHTGFTDNQLEEFTALVEPLITSVDGREAQLKPEIVLEVEYEEIQESPKYGSGFALRFPRLSRIRDDLDPVDIDTLERVQRLYDQQ